MVLARPLPGLGGRGGRAGAGGGGGPALGGGRWGCLAWGRVGGVFIYLGVFIYMGVPLPFIWGFPIGPLDLNQCPYCSSSLNDEKVVAGM